MSWKNKIAAQQKATFLSALHSGITINHAKRIRQSLKSKPMRKGIKQAINEFKSNIKPMRAA